MENPPLKTRMTIRMISPWLTHPGKSLRSQRDWNFQIRPKEWFNLNGYYNSLFGRQCTPVIQF
jgi:hypothetical protein